MRSRSHSCEWGAASAGHQGLTQEGEAFVAWEAPPARPPASGSKGRGAERPGPLPAVLQPPGLRPPQPAPPQPALQEALPWYHFLQRKPPLS